ncbi:MAG: hypothetical protein AAF203_08060, partial [Pseudomonadota bacterium]
QKKLNSANAVCPGKGEAPGAMTIGKESSYFEREQFFDLYTSILATGIKCGRTRIATIMHPGNKEAHSNWHDWSHNDPHDAPYNHRQVVADNIRWIIETSLVPLLEKLNTPESGGQTFLDNSLILFGSVNSWAHNQSHLPIFTLGSAGGLLETGHYLDYRNRDRSDGKGIYYNQLMITVLRSMGLSDADIAANGNYAYSGILPSGRGYAYSPSVAQMASRPLPFLWKGVG